MHRDPALVAASCLSARYIAFASSCSQPTMFTNARDFTIYGGNFINNGDTEPQATAQERNTEQAQAMAMFRTYISPGAMYDSAVRSDVPKCHENTRKAIVRKISRWERSPSDHPFLWMYGPAGCGKTTIAQTMAERFDDSGVLAASFFFSRSAPGRPTVKDQFVATVAYQLCLALPDLRPYTLRALVADWTILDKALTKQADVLVINPLNAFTASRDLHADPDPAPRVIIIDGLDECTPSESHKEILDVMALCRRESSFPLMFLVSSRPESTIRTCFSSRSLWPFTEGLPLDNNYQASRDIHSFVISEFNKIKEHHPAGRDLPSNWPSETDVQYLVTKSSGQFVYASMAMKYVSDVHRHPLRSLMDIMGISTTNAMPFADLDALYIFCLSSVPPQNLEYVLDIFFWMMTPSIGGHSYYKPGLSPCTKSLRWADTLFAREILGTTRTHLDGLHSIIFVPQSNNEELAFFHASFSDFLYDQSRSGAFCVDPGISGARLACRISTTTHLNKPAAELEFDMQQMDILRIMFFYCRQSLLTLELQERLYALDAICILKYTPAIPEQYWWGKVSLFLNFAIWLKEQQLTHIHQSLYSHFLAHIRTVINTLSPPYSGRTRHYTSMILTFPLRMYAYTKPYRTDVTVSFLALFADYALLDTRIGMLHHLLAAKLAPNCGIFGETILGDRSLQLICHILNPSPMDNHGQYYADSSQYTKLAQVVAAGLSARMQDIATQSAIHTIPLENYFLGISMFLTKCNPDPKLAHSLLDSCLTITSEQFNNFDKFHHYMYDGFCTACLIYIHESGISFTDHNHPPRLEGKNFFCAPCHIRSSDELCMLDHVGTYSRKPF
ncbi:hypothetical protein D9619_012663 [Psilocybe cf. subviscida]|uniref:Nephrocystin 3-like N-terminal domain-containing protein n=1 Tax=Psilocybe cf. subviscida TaxID=2480587 RepID=A0A8H5B6Z1_9AGAR|nr:hypothetical protein D9619_012663 [Psilocybe cf. subviscida]